MFLFNVFFIATAQSVSFDSPQHSITTICLRFSLTNPSSLQVLLYLITTPAYILLLASRLTGEQMQSADLVFSRLLMGLVLFEFFADQQQWDFHKAKAEYQKTAKVPPKWTRSELDRGFCSSGLWAWSRHPNFLAEQSIWALFYQWSCWETGTLYNWSGIGAMSYLILFQSSTWLTERITAGKYPEYKIYQQKVGKFLPTGLSWLEYTADQEIKSQKKK